MARAETAPRMELKVIELLHKNVINDNLIFQFSSFIKYLIIKIDIHLIFGNMKKEPGD